MEFIGTREKSRFWWVKVVLYEGDRTSTTTLWGSSVRLYGFGFPDFWEGLKLGADFTLLQLCGVFGCRAV